MMKMALSSPRTTGGLIKRRRVCFITMASWVLSLLPGEFVKKILLALLLGLPAFAQVSIGIRIGPPPRPRVVRVVPARPGPDYSWIDGYWYPVGTRYVWHSGYWTRAPYPAARWIAPRFE